jgi:adenine-specific DNA-methyltransferase
LTVYFVAAWLHVHHVWQAPEVLGKRIVLAYGPEETGYRRPGANSPATEHVGTCRKFGEGVEVSRLTDLIATARAKDAALGTELESEFKVLSSRRAFGLNFERHRPESVELPGRPIRKGDKVRVLPRRGSTAREDDQLWKVVCTRTEGTAKLAEVEKLSSGKSGRDEFSVEDLVVVAEFNDYIYPGLVSTGKIERGGDRPFHTVINAENFHALEALTFTHRGAIDAIYIDPPYNSGATDWKYNNDYVGKDDLYRHSKWLAFIERRLSVAKFLLNPESSALICSIDEKEFLNLGLLLRQTFPEARMQMVSSTINAKGIIRDNEFSRTNEFLFFLFFGSHRITQERTESNAESVRWASLRRSDTESARGTQKGGPAQFYPIYVEEKTGKIRKIGSPLSPDEDVATVPTVTGCITVLPIREKGDVLEMNWGLTVQTLAQRLSKGFVRAVVSGKRQKKVTIYYLTSGQIEDIAEGNIVVTGHDTTGAAVVAYADGKRSNPTTQWSKEAHNAQSHGSDLLRALIPGREFPFPKSLYAVEDCLRIAVGDAKNATILDFFSGSGTTAHAVMRLNRQDGGRRRCISVTNNEVAADEQENFRKENLRAGDPKWEQWGICDYITKPRIAAAITGTTPEGKDVAGQYKFVDAFPMADGFEENAEFFTLTYETPVAISHNRAFSRIAPLLWMRAGSEGRQIESLPKQGWDVADTFGLLIDLDKAVPFVKKIKAKDTVRIAFIVTDDERRFQSIARRLREGVEAVRLYESYLNNFRFSMGR